MHLNRVNGSFIRNSKKFSHNFYVFMAMRAIVAFKCSTKKRKEKMRAMFITFFVHKIYVPKVFFFFCMTAKRNSKQHLRRCKEKNIINGCLMRFLDNSIESFSHSSFLSQFAFGYIKPH